MAIRYLSQRLGAGLSWRAGRLQRRLIGVVESRSGVLARRLRWPVPWLAPYRRLRLALVREGGLGDVLMCTPALRRLKQVNPACHVTFYTRYGDLLRGLPYIDEVRDFGEQPADALVLGYDHGISPRRHIARILADELGLDVTDIRPDCVFEGELVEGWTRAWRSLPRPWVVINRSSSPWTPNKDWPDPLWDELIDRLTAWASVIEIGSNAAAPGSRLERNYPSLVGRTTLGPLIAAVATADVHVGPVSGPVHIAASVGTPAVVIYGGYEHPACSAYPGNINLTTILPCSPCWMREPCPIGKECLQRITPAAVEAAVGRLRETRQRRVDTFLVAPRV